MTLFANPFMAIAFGAFMLCTETCFHFEDIIRPSSWIALPIHDWMAGSFLVGSGWISRRDRNRGRPYQAAAWAFTASLLLGAFVGHWKEWTLGQFRDEWVSLARSWGSSPHCSVWLLADWRALWRDTPKCQRISVMTEQGGCASPTPTATAARTRPISVNTVTLPRRPRRVVKTWFVERLHVMIGVRVSQQNVQRGRMLLRHSSVCSSPSKLARCEL
jgi:hypothetical protein